MFAKITPEMPTDEKISILNRQTKRYLWIAYVLATFILASLDFPLWGNMALMGGLAILIWQFAVQIPRVSQATLDFFDGGLMCAGVFTLMCIVPMVYGFLTNNHGYAVCISVLAYLLFTGFSNSISIEIIKRTRAEVREQMEKIIEELCEEAEEDEVDEQQIDQDSDDEKLEESEVGKK